MSNIAWFPGHMAKGLRQMREVLPYVDVLVETVDARIPQSGRSPQVREFREKRPCLTVLNKRDLADPVLLDQWLRAYEDAGLDAMALDSGNPREISALEQKLFALGSERLQRDQAKGREGRPLRVMVMGIPNSGKSTIINRMSGKRARPAEDRAGVTVQVAWVRSHHKGLECLDSPGVLSPEAQNPRAQTKLAACSALPEHILDRETIAYQSFLMLAEFYPEAIEETYGVTGPWTLDLSLDYPKFEEAALKRSCIMSGGRPDMARFSDLFMKDLRQGKLGQFCWDCEPGEEALR